MAWIEKRKRYRLRDELNGKRVVIVKDLGIWKEAADAWKVEFEKALARGFTFTPPIKVSDISAFLKAHTEGLEVPNMYHRIPVEEMCDLLVKHHGPSFKGGVNNHWKSPFYIWRCRVWIIKSAWEGKFSDEINAHDVRDLLARYNTVGTRMKYLRTISQMFNAISEWNDQGILKEKVKLPPFNPGRMWRKKMKPAEKRELPDTRVLSPEEWAAFSPHLTGRAFSICDIALRRFLRRSDIKNICSETLSNGFLEDIQEKTGDRYTIPALKNQPQKYDFRNFRKEFLQAQVDAKMDYPMGHPLRFSLRSLRRTGATWAYRATKDIVSIQKMLGHRSISTTIRYLNISEADTILIAKEVDNIADSALKKVGTPVGKVSENTNNGYTMGTL